MFFLSLISSRCTFPSGPNPTQSITTYPEIPIHFFVFFLLNENRIPSARGFSSGWNTASARKIWIDKQHQSYILTKEFYPYSSGWGQQMHSRTINYLLLKLKQLNTRISHKIPLWTKSARAIAFDTRMLSNRLLCESCVPVYVYCNYRQILFIRNYSGLVCHIMFSFERINGGCIVTRSFSGPERRFLCDDAGWNQSVAGNCWVFQCIQSNIISP